jgi:histidinol-phosphate aminotransferase
MSSVRESKPSYSGPRPRPGILRIDAYKQGASIIDGVETPIKLSANESALGPSPRALAAYHAAATTLCRYPDGAQLALREAISNVHRLDSARIVCGNGSDEILSLLMRAYVGPGDDVVLSEYSFGMCRIHATAQGANIITAREPEFRISATAILHALTPKTRVVAIATPNNPPGTYIPAAELERLHAGLPADVLLIVDSAYAEFVTAADYDPGTALAHNTANVIMTRTFSKLHGLAALRIGWAYGAAPIIDLLQRIRTPFNTNAPAIAAATAAMLDTDYAARVRNHNSEWLERMTSGLTRLGLEVIPSVTNFVFVRFPDPSRGAQAAWEFLRIRGIIPRPVAAGGPHTHLRITIGLAEENEAVLSALADFMSATGNVPP